MLRNCLVRSSNIDLADRQVDTTTVAHTLSQTVELNGDTDSDRLLVVHLVEVDVEQCVSHRMELQFLHHGSVNLTVDNELYYIDVGSVNHLAELSHWANERSGYGQTVLVLLLAVHVTWDKTLFAQHL